MTRPKRAATIAGRFQALPANQRILLGVFGCVFSLFGLSYADTLEQARILEKRNERMALEAAQRAQQQ